MVKNLPANTGDAGYITGLGRSPGEGTLATHSVFLPGEFHRQRSLVSYSPWGRKGSKMTERQTSSRRL